MLNGIGPICRQLQVNTMANFLPLFSIIVVLGTVLGQDIDYQVDADNKLQRGKHLYYE